MSEDAKEFIAVFIIFCVAVGLLFGAIKWKGNSNEKDFMAEISSYETISINGEDYKTDEVTSVTSHPGIYMKRTHMKSFSRTAQRFTFLRTAIP